MTNENVQTEARVGRALVALQMAKRPVTAKDWAAAASVDESEIPAVVEELRGLGVNVEATAKAKPTTPLNEKSVEWGTREPTTPLNEKSVEWGTRDESITRMRWRLVGAADVPLAEVVEPKIAGTVFAGGVKHFATIGSTNVEAMRAGIEAIATQGDEGWTRRGAVWISEEQTAGKGRAGHKWKSDAGDGIYCSALLRPKLTPTDAITLSLVAGLAVAEAVHEVTGMWGDLRWPNDVLMGGKKFCGILTELNSEFSRVRFVVVGMGLNVNNASFPEELEAIATSLRMEAGRRFSRVELVAALLRQLDREQKALEQGVDAQRERILRRFEEHSSFCRDCAVTVEEDGGYEGVTKGLDARGFLRVETTQGMRTVLSGGVRKR